jgi:hypothetical protein
MFSFSFNFRDLISYPGLAGPSIQMATQPKTYSSLDSLLEETKDDKSFVMVTSLSQEDSLLLEDEGLTDEQKNLLSLFTDEERKISSKHPGKAVINKDRCGHVFTASLSPASCGLTSQSVGALGSHFVSQYHSDQLLDLLSSDIIPMAFHAQPFKMEQIQRWLFFILSIHGNRFIVKKCKEQLLQLLRRQIEEILVVKKTANTYAPSIADVKGVFVNWGADEKELRFEDDKVSSLGILVEQVSYQKIN